MTSLHLLDSHLIDLIAAGEVVERPSSVVKELAENALDAGADQILITIEKGGKDRITVLDNGSGMTRDEALLCVQRHATSKISSQDDLFSVRSLGFRGEALAAISAVSRFELTTCADESVGGFQLRIEGGKEVAQTKLGFPQGTRIVIEDLFYNTPARQKFLKAIATEYQQIHDLVLRLALARPQVQFRLTHNKKVVLNLAKGESFAERVKNGFGIEMAKNLVSIEHEESYLRFYGLFGHPSGGTRPSKRWQQLFFNGRSARCRPVEQAIYEGYKTLLMKNEHPIFFCQVELDPLELDVNVHPAKAEVKVKNPALINTILSQALQRQLKAASRREFFGEVAPFKAEDAGSPSADRVQERMIPQEQLSPGTFVVPSEQIGFRSTAPRKSAPFTPESPSLAPEVLPDTTRLEPEKEEPFVFSEEKGLTQTAEGQAPFGVIGQLEKKYILAQGEGSLILIDQHAAHERIRFEEIRGQFYGQGVQTTPLLIPQVIELPPQDGLLLEQHLEHWQKLGFDLAPFGGNDYKLSAVPTLLQGQDAGQVIRAVLDEMSQFGRSGKLELFFNEVFEKMACHSAIRAGQALSLEEMRGLIDQLAGLDLLIHCPHGRPVLVKFGVAELDKKFKRIV